MSDLNQLAATARRLRIATGMALVAVVGVFGYVSAATLMGFSEGVRFAQTGAGLVPSSLGVGAALLAAIPFCLALWRLMRMLRCVQAGELFSGRTIAELRGFALFLLLTGLASAFAAPLIALLWALSAGEGEVALTLTFDASDFFLVLIGALLLLIARLFGEAERIADENRQIV